MPPTAPLRVPVELRREGEAVRSYRRTVAISEEGLLFPRPLPEGLSGPLALSFHLPETEPEDGVEGEAPAPRGPLCLHGVAIEVAPGPDDEDAGPQGGIRFLDASADVRSRIARYVEERLLG